MNETMKVILGLVGGLAIFIYGMNMMSECLQKAAGEKMKSILSMLTKNPVLGVLAGALTTAVLQSSSATTVMAIGFIIAFISKKEKVKNIGQTIFAFGLLFLGIETMGSVMKPLASSAFFVDLIGKVSTIPVLGVGVGALMTLVVQSSSATIAVLQNFASQAGPDGVSSIIGLTGAIPILLGDNIGTTITAVIASIGQPKDARRTAFAHCVFNISGAILFLFLVKPYAALIQYISPKGNEVDVISRQIANAHTGFNLTMTLIWIPLIPIMVKIVMWLVPDKKNEEQKLLSMPKYLDTKLIAQPTAALLLVAREIMNCSDIVAQMLDKIRTRGGKNEAEVDAFVQEHAKSLQALNTSINDYLASMYSEGVLNEEQAAQSAGMLYILCDIDRIGQLALDITVNLQVQNKGKHKYSKEAVKELKKAIDQICTIYRESIQRISGDDDITIQDVQSQKESIMNLDEKIRKNHISRVGKGKCDSKLTAPFNEVLHNIERIGNSCVNLVEVAEDKAIMQSLLAED